jgi:hypothetical protein
VHCNPALNTLGTPVIDIKLSQRACRLCALQSPGTRAHPPRRSVGVYPEAEPNALTAARERDTTEAFALNPMPLEPAWKELAHTQPALSGFAKPGISAWPKRLFSMFSPRCP